MTCEVPPGQVASGVPPHPGLPGPAQPGIRCASVCTGQDFWLLQSPPCSRQGLRNPSLGSCLSVPVWQDWTGVKRRPAAVGRPGLPGSGGTPAHTLSQTEAT